MVPHGIPMETKTAYKINMLKDFNATPDDPEELKEANRLLVDEVKSLSLKVEQL